MRRILREYTQSAAFGQLPEPKNPVLMTEDYEFTNVGEGVDLYNLQVLTFNFNRDTSSSEILAVPLKLSFQKKKPSRQSHGFMRKNTVAKFRNHVTQLWSYYE